MIADRIEYQVGIPEAQREEAVALYDEAFGAKFAVAVPDREQRSALMASMLSLPFAVAAISDGQLVGLAGYHTADGALTGDMTGRQILQQLGLQNGLRAIAVFSLYERKLQAGELLMDGIAVRFDKRGLGIGTRLLEEIKQLARDEEYERVRLDVIDTNPGARRLYEREGFVATHTDEFEFLRRVLGFGAVTTMEYRIQSD